ncbi:MAG: DUF885 domain-containing protein [Bacillota bacterium]|jgi:hypothetical protein
MLSQNKLSESVLDVLWSLDPVGSSHLGVTKYDGCLPPAQEDRVSEILGRLSRYAEEMDSLLKRPDLSASERLDFEFALANVRALLLKALSSPDRRNNPNWYMSAVNAGLHVLAARDWGSSQYKADRIAERLSAVPEFLEQGKRSLVPQDVPPEWIEIALASVRGHAAIIENSVRPLLESIRGGSPADRKLCEESLRAVSSFGRFLSAMAAEAKGRFASGREYFEYVLRNVHMVDMDAYTLREFGREKVREYEAMLVAAARRIDPNKHWTELITEFKRCHPTPEDLLDSYRSEVRRAEEFVRERDLISIPEGQRWSVLPTPEFSRATSPLGHMRTSPPFADGLDSVLYITPIDPAASAERQRQHLEDNCYAFQRTIAFHEVIPGHHLQSCLSKIGVSDLRKQFRSTVFVEGWGLYTEVLMAEQGYLADPATTLINLKNALWRAVRVVVDVGLHVDDMTLAEATRLLQDNVRMEHHMASGEARRYTMSPTYQSSYLLGKEQILKLRSDYQAKLGSAYTLKGFHDRLTGYGSVPVSLVRREMMAGR